MLLAGSRARRSTPNSTPLPAIVAADVDGGGILACYQETIPVRCPASGDKHTAQVQTIVGLQVMMIRRRLKRNNEAKRPEGVYLAT